MIKTYAAIIQTELLSLPTAGSLLSLQKQMLKMSLLTIFSSSIIK